MEIDDLIPKKMIDAIGEKYAHLSYLGASYDPFTNTMLNSLMSNKKRKMYYLTFEEEEQERTVMFVHDPEKKWFILNYDDSVLLQEDGTFLEKDIIAICDIFSYLHDVLHENPKTRLLLVTGDYRVIIPTIKRN